MQYQNILIDVSNFFFRNYSIYNKEKLINGEEEIAHKAILGFFISIKKFKDFLQNLQLIGIFYLIILQVEI